MDYLSHNTELHIANALSTQLYATLCRTQISWYGLQPTAICGRFLVWAKRLRAPDLKGTGTPLDLDLDIGASLIGRKARAVSGEVLRELTSRDLALLDTERGIKPSAINRLSERHHALARCLASGLSVSDACAITGYTPSRVSILKGDPSFEELIAFYQSGKAELVQDLGDKMRANAVEAQNIIAERLEDEPEAIGIDTLLDITKIGADRTGFGPASRTTNLHIHTGLADRLKTARQGAAAPGPPKLIEGSAAPTITGGKDADD